jgi:uncharacterized membrane protein YcaP (DUF421 family)
MNYLIEVFGEGNHLNVAQMSCRGIAIFLFALVLIRISGRRSFGIRTPLDNIIVILLGAVLSRAVTGASPILPTVVTCTVIVIMHRLFGWLVVKYKFFGELVEGNKILLYKNGRFIDKNMDRALVCEEDIMQGVRKTALTESLEQIEIIYIERNGEITAIKK